MSSQPKIAIVGLGSIGMKHLAHLTEMGHTNLVGYDVRPNVEETRLPVLDGFESLLRWQPEYAIVATPPDQHYDQAQALLAAGAHVFIEKPMAIYPWHGEELCATASRHQRTLAVGYMLRAHRPLQQVKSVSHVVRHARIWCHWKATPKSYPFGGVVSETSHEIDLALWLFGPVVAVREFQQAGRHTATMMLEHAQGTVTDIHLQSNAENYDRGIRCDQGEALRYGPDLNEAYRDELQAFLAGAPRCTGEEGVAALKVMEQLG